ncbi:hypothetical protein BJX64DRAFT_288219 [Aspergillus heterothallicus]
MDIFHLLFIFVAALLVAEIFRLGLVYLDISIRRRRQQMQMDEVGIEHQFAREAGVREGSRATKQRDLEVFSEFFVQRCNFLPILILRNLQEPGEFLTSHCVITVFLHKLFTLIRDPVPGFLLVQPISYVTEHCATDLDLVLTRAKL